MEQSLDLFYEKERLENLVALGSIMDVGGGLLEMVAGIVLRRQSHQKAHQLAMQP